MDIIEFLLMIAFGKDESEPVSRPSVLEPSHQPGPVDDCNHYNPYDGY